MDILSKDILKQALLAFDGTLIVVSHDRDFLDGLVDKMYEFRDGRVKEHLGTVSEFLERRKLETLQELERRFTEAPKPAEESKVQSQQAFAQRKMAGREIRKKQNRIDWLEKTIGELEGKQSQIETVLSAPGPSDDVMELTREYLENKIRLDAYTEEWSTLLEELDN